MALINAGLAIVVADGSDETGVEDLIYVSADRLYRVCLVFACMFSSVIETRRYPS